jgi:hypothetical protein
MKAVSVKHHSWRWRNRKPRCDNCNSARMTRTCTQVDWQTQTVKLIWRCDECANHVFVYAHKGDGQQQQVA